MRRTPPESITFHIERPENLWLAEIDPSQLESALLNNELNARDAMPDGGRITIEIKNAELDDAYVQDDPDLVAGQYVLIAVKDTGHGMDEETRSRVFEPFFTTKDIGRGSGLGLSMVYGFVKQSGGHVRICSEAGRGTSVTLCFPRLARESGESQTVGSVQPTSGGTETILVVEDDERVRQHARATLTGLGYAVIEAEDGLQALDILKRAQDVDLLFADIVLPGGMNGRVLADVVRALQPDSEVELLGKPYRRSQLAAKLRKVLDQRGG